MLAVTDAEIARWLGELVWPLIRGLALFAFAPAFGSSAVPAPVKVALGLAVAAIIGGIAGPMAPLDLSWHTATLVIEQILVGGAIGFAMRLTLSVMAFAGDLSGLQMGFGFATLLNPQVGVPMPALADFFDLLGTVLFLAIGGHLLLIAALVKSFAIVPVSAAAGIVPAGWGALAAAGSALFQLGMVLALPVVAAMLAINIAMAVVSRVAPQLNIMSVGFAVFLWTGIAATALLMPFVAPAVEHLVEVGLRLIETVLRGGG
ncbi:MAG: flagellar biosynthetic protein FliR [Alphaproteobacteria bacterium]|nr:flagellar biosynthetic protein FliR [Alphaproteobacteria bacterium]